MTLRRQRSGPTKRSAMEDPQRWSGHGFGRKAAARTAKSLFLSAPLCASGTVVCPDDGAMVLLAHRPAVSVAGRGVRFGIVGRLPGLILWAGGLCIGVCLGFEAGARGIELCLQRATSGEFLGQRLRVLAVGIGGLSLLGQLRDVGCEFAGAVRRHGRSAPSVSWTHWRRSWCRRSTPCPGAAAQSRGPAAGLAGRRP